MKNQWRLFRIENRPLKPSEIQDEERSEPDTNMTGWASVLACIIVPFGLVGLVSDLLLKDYHGSADAYDPNPKSTTAEMTEARKYDSLYSIGAHVEWEYMHYIQKSTISYRYHQDSIEAGLLPSDQAWEPPYE